MKSKYPPLPDTLLLPDIGQRRSSIPHIGVVIGTCGTPAYIRLGLHLLRAMHEDIPILVVNDGDTPKWDAPALARLCEEYGADFVAGKYLGHSCGDLRVFQEGLQWAAERNIQLLVKFSRRFIPLVQWRHSLLVAADGNRFASAFGRFEQDRPGGMLRTDCIALRVEKWIAPDVMKILEARARVYWKGVNVESIFKSIVDSLGPVDHWDLISQSMYRPHAKSLTWRGVLPEYYADVAREYGLDMKAVDFRDGAFGTVEEEIDHPELQPGYRKKPQPLNMRMMIAGEDLAPPGLPQFKKYPVITAVDDRMVEAAIKLLRSINKHAKGAFSDYVCLYEALSLDPANLTKLRGAGWRTLPTDVPELPAPVGTVPDKVARLRSNIPDLFPNDSYALYLDADMLFVHDTPESSEWPVWVGQNCVGAVRCASVEEEYYNSGFMLMNLDLWRKLKIGERSLTMLEEWIKTGAASGNETPHDENVLNYLFKKHGVIAMPAALNVTPGRPGEPNEEKWRIVHFRGPKPWIDYAEDDKRQILMDSRFHKYANVWRDA